MTAPHLEDQLAIQDLFVRYATALDDGEVDTVIDCFTADAALESPAIGRIEGREEIRGFAEGFAARREAGVQFRHFVTNITVKIDGRGARATAYLLVLISRDGGHRTLPPGRYECELSNNDGKWRFTRRTVFHDHAYALDDP